MKVPIGFSLNNLSETTLSIKEKIQLFLDAGATAIEIGLMHKSYPEVFLLDDVKKLLLKFDYISIHSSSATYYPDDTDAIKSLKTLCEGLPINTVVVHADRVTDFEALTQYDIPWAIENMDKDKLTGRSPDFFRSLTKDHTFNFVIDVQHLWEFDPKSVQNFLAAMEQRIVHYHVSGSNPELGDIRARHCPLHLSTNVEQIKQILRELPLHAIILEGLLDGSSEEVKEEMKYVLNLD